jgi:hypothetical protein
MRYRITTTDEETIAVRMPVFSPSQESESRDEIRISISETWVSDFVLVADGALRG